MAKCVSALRLIKLSLFALALTSCGSGGGGSNGASSACDALGAKIAKVTGGEQCEGGLSPVVALIFSDASGRQGICSGTLISLTSILTAGHCLDNAVAVDVYTQQGLLAEGGQKSVHPNWLSNPQAGNPYDIALLRIGTPQNIGPVPLLVSDDIRVGESINVFGYGLDENEQNAIDRIQNGEAPLKAGSMLIGGLGGGLFEAAFDDTGSAICQGDSGGPVTQTIGGVTSLVGVTSYTRGGCVDGGVSGFIDIQRQDIVDYILDIAPDAALR